MSNTAIVFRKKKLKQNLTYFYIKKPLNKVLHKCFKFRINNKSTLDAGSDSSNNGTSGMEKRWRDALCFYFCWIL